MSQSPTPRRTRAALAATIQDLSAALSDGNRIIQEKNALIAALQLELALLRDRPSRKRAPAPWGVSA